MAVAWNSLQREAKWAPWKCSKEESARSCGSGWRGDALQYQKDKYCQAKNRNCGKDIGCPTSCKGDQIKFLGCSAIHNRYKASCFKNNYNTSDNTLRSCCSGRIAPQDCHVNYYKGSSQCQSFMERYCNNSRLFNQTDCKIWASLFPDKSSALKNNICKGDNLKHPVCQEWCNSNPDKCSTRIANYCTLDKLENEFCKTQTIKYGGIDNIAQQWCSTHLDDPYCACFNSIKEGSAYKGDDEDLKKIFARPECFEINCSGGLAYQTYNMRPERNKSCPDVQLCQNSVQSLGNVNTNITEIKQDCKQSSNEETSQSSNEETNTMNDSDNNTLNEDNTIYLILLIIIVCVLITGSGVVYYRYVNRKENIVSELN